MAETGEKDKKRFAEWVTRNVVLSDKDLIDSKWRSNVHNKVKTSISVDFKSNAKKKRHFALDSNYRKEYIDPFYEDIRNEIIWAIEAAAEWDKSGRSGKPNWKGLSRKEASDIVSGKKWGAEFFE